MARRDDPTLLDRIEPDCRAATLDAVAACLLQNDVHGATSALAKARHTDLLAKDDELQRVAGLLKQVPATAELILNSFVAEIGKEVQIEMAASGAQKLRIRKVAGKQIEAIKTIIAKDGTVQGTLT